MQTHTIYDSTEYRNVGTITCSEDSLFHILCQAGIEPESAIDQDGDIVLESDDLAYFLSALKDNGLIISKL